VPSDDWAGSPGRLNSVRLQDASFVVIDFEALALPGQPLEPVEVAAQIVRPGLTVDPGDCWSSLMRPETEVEFSARFLAQVGLREADVESAAVAHSALSELEDGLRGVRPFRLVAQNAPFEAAILRRCCPEGAYLSDHPMIDTVALSRRLLPGVGRYDLDSVARFLGLPIPAQRHRALPDAQLTAAVFVCLAERSLSAGMSTVGELLAVAGVAPPSRRADHGASDASTLF
jgi:DNA polymerase III subunit epsilon